MISFVCSRKFFTGDRVPLNAKRDLFHHMPNNTKRLIVAATFCVSLLPGVLLGQAIDVERYYDKAVETRAKHPDSARFYTDAIFEAFAVEKPDSSELFFIIESASLRRYLNDFSKSREVLVSVLPYAKEPGNEKQLAFLYQVLGIIDSQQGRYQLASENFFKGLQLYEVTGDTLNKATLLKELGIVHERLKMSDLALQYGKESLSVIRSIGDSSTIAGFLSDVGTMHQNIGKFEEALPYQLESLKINRLIGEEEAIPFNFHNIGDIYLHLGMLDSAEVYTRMAYDGFEKYDLKFTALYSLMNLGVLSMERGNYREAEDFLQQSYNRAKEFDGLFEQTMLLEKLSTLYERMGRFETALQFYRKRSVLNDSLSDADRDRMILDMSESYKNDQAAQEIARLRDQEVLSDRLITTQQVFLIVVTLILIAFVVALMMMIRANKFANRLNKDLIDANVRLNNMSEERNNLIHVMAHDLRTPLAQVSGLNELLKESKNISNEQLEFVQLIDVATTNGLSLITQMMESNSNWSLTESSKEFVEVDLHRIIDNSLSLYEAQARSKNIKLVFDNEVGNQKIHSDPQAIRRVIDNLVSNAIKYTYHDTEVNVNLTTSDNTISICVRDSGPGFSDDDKLLLFRKFTTLSARPTGNESSTGLGLAIVYDLLNEVGGTIKLIDDGQPGACFCVMLPKI